MMVESTPNTIAPLLLRNLLTSVYIFSDKSLTSFAHKSKLLQIFRYFLTSIFLFFLRLLPLLFSSLNPNIQENFPIKNQKHDLYAPACAAGDTGIARALSQLLSIVNNIPVSSRKYEVVRSLAERVIDENNEEGVEALKEVNRSVLSAALARTLAQLEDALEARGVDGGGGGESSGAGEDREVEFRVNRVLRVARSVWKRVGRGEGVSRSGSSAEKLAAEVLWLAQKMATCGFGEDAVWRWASASNLASLGLSAEPRLQGSLVKVSAFLLKQAKDMGREETEESKKEERRETKKKMLMSWVPLLCRASNGTDVPVLSIRERGEVERVVEEIIDMLEEEEQEKVLSLWLHHFTFSPSSDWPNLHTSYAKWCTASRKLLLINSS